MAAFEPITRFEPWESIVTEVPAFARDFCPQLPGERNTIPADPVVVRRLTTDDRRPLNPSQRPARTPRRDHMFPPYFAQDTTHANRG
jgi:hypothetical protein